MDFHKLLARLDLRVTLTYLVVSLLWIVFSDRVMEVVASGNQPLLVSMSTAKGTLFVIISGLVLFLGLRSELRKRNFFEQALEADMDKQTATLETLRESEQRFSMIFHGSPVPTGISRFDNAKIVDVNEALLKLFGYKREELLGHTSAEMHLFDYPESREDIIRTIKDSGYLRDHEVLGHTKAGEKLHLLASSQLIELGNQPHMVSMFYDVSEHRKLEEQIQYQALLLRNFSDAVVSTDINLNIRNWNPSAETIYGWKAEEVLGKPVEDILLGEFTSTSLEEARQELEMKGSWQGTVIQKRKDGTPIHVLASTSYIRDSTGNRVGVVSVNRDITDLQKAEEERQSAERLRMELEQQAGLLRMKEDFISVVSHEFRTPLSVIVSSSELMRNYYDRMPRERQMHHIEIILAQAQFMTELMDDVLIINKAGAGKLEFNPVPLNLVTFCQETLERIEVLNHGKHRFIFTHEGELNDVRLDVKQLQHILVNLLSNAVKYSPEGGDVRLDVKAEDSDVEFRISDQGIGIPEESLVHLFEPFYRGRNTGDIGGTGLGLPIVKASVDRHGGTITCETEINAGSTFIVRLPARHDVQAPKPAVASDSL